MIAAVIWYIRKEKANKNEDKCRDERAHEHCDVGTSDSSRPLLSQHTGEEEERQEIGLGDFEMSAIRDHILWTYRSAYSSRLAFP